MLVKVLQNALLEHSAILLTFIKPPPVFKTFVLSIFEWLLKTGFTVVQFCCKTGEKCTKYVTYAKLHRFVILYISRSCISLKVVQ